MRRLIETAVERRVTVVMVSLAVVAFGFVGYSRLALELFPDIAYPSLTIQTDFPDTAPEEVETLITRPVEEAVGVLQGLHTIHSVSRPGVSEVTLEFDWESDMDLRSMEVREKLDRIVLPEEAEDPLVLRFDPSLEPILRVALAGGDSLVRLRDHAERKLKQELETIKGVAAAKVKGGFEEEIQIAIDQERLAALGISLERVRQVVERSNVNLPGGSLRGRDDQFLIRTVNEFDDVEEISGLIVYSDGDASVRLAEVADVYRGTREREEITRVNGQESVEIAIYKEGDANTVTVAENVRGRLAGQQEKLPPGSRLVVLFDQSGFIRGAVNEVRNAALIGGLLAICVLFVFLRDLRSTLIVATSIPVSVIATFVAMYRLDISLNIMSLGGLTLGVGMLVDSSIVVLESIFRRRKEGLTLTRSAVEGASEVGPAVFASTLTTVAVFLPIVFVEGIAGQLFSDQAMTVTLSLLASLVVALTLIPMLSAMGGHGARAVMTPSAAAAASSGAEPAMTLGAFSRSYDRFLRGAVRLRWLTVVVACALFGLSIVGLRGLGTELIPSLSEGEFFFEVRLPEGASLERTDRVIASMERVVADRKDVELYYSTIGSRTIAGGMSLNTRAENLGQLNIVVRSGDGAGAGSEAFAASTGGTADAEERVLEALRAAYESIPDLEVKYGKPSYFSLKTPIEVVIFGEDLEALRSRSLEIARRLGELDGFVDVRSSLEAGNPEVQVRFDRRRLATLGLELSVLSETLKYRVLGVVPTRFKEGDRQIDIRVRNEKQARASLADVRRLVVPGPAGEPIRLGQVADVELGRGPAEIHRLQQQRAVVITANLKGRSLGSAIEAAKRTLADLGPVASGAELGGQNREMEVSFASLRFAIIMAVFLVYLVMASTFESFIHPFVVLLTIPLSLVGVVAGLILTGTTISVIVFIGSILLVGIVVNNAIVLIDTVNRLRRSGVDKVEAVVRAGHIRLRPIVMTTLTTVLGLLPMAIGWGEGAELRAPLAITVASGLALSMLLTLVVIPAVYVIVPSHVKVRDPGESPGREEGGAA